MSGLIYMLRNKVNGKSYIGKTIDLKRRIKEHKVENRIVVDKAIDKYGFENFEVIILENNIKEKGLNNREIYWIDHYDTYEGEGYNCSKGGDGTALPGKLNPMYGRTGSKHPLYGKPRSEEVKEKIRKSLQGFRHSEESKKKMSKNRRGINNQNTKVTKEYGLKVYNYYINKDCSYSDVYKKYNDVVGYTTIKKICKREHWTTKNIEGVC